MKCPNCGTILFAAKKCKVCQYDFATGQVDYTNAKFISGAKCPSCGSTRVIEMPKWKRPTFCARIPQECIECHHTWEAPTSRWLLGLGAVAGTVFALMGVASLIQGVTGSGTRDSSISVGFIFLFFGGAALFGCLKRLSPSRQVEKPEGEPTARSAPDAPNPPKGVNDTW